jgi:CheY-like chemotaxis protein
MATQFQDLQVKTMARKKILLVDDAETILVLERMILGREYDLITARDGRQAVEKTATEQPDLVLLDIVMPAMDGIEACKAIRGNDATRSIPIIIVTTRGETQNVEAAYNAGCDDYVTKPINSQELLGKVRKLLGE